MSILQNLEWANERNCLWPPIADAVDTFVRRRDQGAGGYERTWRLIHVWESVSITLASMAVVCTRESENLSVSYRRMREALYGKTWNEIDRTFKTSPGALDGSIDRWIDILFLATKIKDVEDAYLVPLTEFLDSEAIQLRPLVNVWATTCDVPPDAVREDRASCTVKTAMRHINTFRNRFAHVPFPYDPINGLADALENVTEQLFSISPQAWKSGGILGGCIVQGTKMMRGGQRYQYPHEPVSDVSFLFPFSTAKNWNPIPRPAAPFLHIDNMARPYVLTRLKDREHGTWEYTRFRAEANAVIARDEESLLTSLPEPTEKEYPSDEVETPEATTVSPAIQEVGDNKRGSVGGEALSPDPAQSFGDAIQAIRNGQFDAAILFFEDLVQKRPTYHIGWLRLGHARREKAARLCGDDHGKATELLRSSIEAFSTATQHREAEYQATAYYERSKARHRLCGIALDEGEVAAAHADAVDACRLSADTRYQTWLEYLERMMPLPAMK